jgi:type I restriction enzyme S subunit
MSERSNISGPIPIPIALMQEYRTRLTADIVTGKLDVREAAPKLPALPTAPEPAADEVPEETESEETEA